MTVARLRAAALVLSLCTVVTRAAAQAPVWIAPQSCPEPRWQLGSESTAEQLRPADEGPSTALSPRVEVVVSEGRWRARLSDPGDPLAPEREFWGASCSEVSRAAEVAWSLFVDERNMAAQGAGDVVPSDAPPSSSLTYGNEFAPTETARAENPASTLKVNAPVQERQATTPSTPAAGLLGLLAPALEAQGVNALLGGVALGALSLERQWGWQVHATGLLGRTRTNVGALELTSVLASAELCVRVGGIGIGLCAGPRVELLRAVAPQIASPTSDIGVLPAVEVSAWFATDPSRSLSWLFEVGGQGRLRGARFLVEREDVYELPGWGVFARLGPAFRL